jgi:formylglycine-generating enzyme required for sulfatase activity
MTDLTIKQVTVADLLLPAALLVGLSVFTLMQLGVLTLRPAQAHPGPQTTVVAARAYEYRLPGDFQMDGAPINGTMEAVQSGPIEVMTHQVTLADYGMCVSDGACKPPQPVLRSERADVPVTGVSFDDAVDYAQWLSDRTGDIWRLPTVAEWIFFAGDRAVDHAVDAPTDAANPAARWIASYEQEASRAVSADAMPQPVGTFGVNDLGITDIAGNVWEWTTTCVNRTTLASDGSTISVVESCGARYLEGRHLTPMSVFVRDSRSGGCAVGAAPDNLGFRLVREPGGWLRLPF